MRIIAILTKRLIGMSLRQIGEEEDPPISLQAVAQLIGRALGEMVIEPLSEVRALELHRLDQLLMGVWQNAKNGDIASIDRCLAISMRRARLMGLDLRPAAYVGPDGIEVDVANPPAIRVEIIGNPEIERMRWLEEERLRLSGETPHSVN
jgi:hypothetical protein